MPRPSVLEGQVDDYHWIRGRQRIGFIGHADVQRGAVDVGKNRDRDEAHFAAGARHTHGNFPAIGDEDLAEHSRSDSK